MNYKKIIFSWDFYISLPLTIIIGCLLPYRISNDFVKDLYSIGITVLSIIFSLYFAALAIIISSGDDKFIQFLEETGKYYTEIISTFKFSLMVLFFALIYSLLIYGITSKLIQNDKDSEQLIWFFLLYIFLFFYGLFATICSVLDSFTYAKYRTRFLLFTNKKEEERK